VDLIDDDSLKELTFKHLVVDSTDSDQSREDEDALQELVWADFSDKQLQKLHKLSDQQIERVKVVTQSVDKSTQAFKKLNKGFKQQSQQLHSKVQSQLGQSVKFALSESTVKLRVATADKVQSYHQECLDQSMAEMRARLQLKIHGWKEEKESTQKRKIDLIEESVSGSFQKELGEVITKTFDRVLEQ
jgi:hypothetical protein